MGALVGLDAKIYRGTAGETADTEMANVRDVTRPDERAEANISRRGTGGASASFHVIKTTRRKIEVNFTMINDDADADVSALRTAYEANTALAFKVVDKDSGKGVDADWCITKFEESHPDETEQTIAVTIKPTYITRWPVAV
jgi:hypothetical protein